MRRVAPAALALAALALTGCETTQEKSAALERVAKRHERAAGAAARGLSIASPARSVKVTTADVVRSSEGAAVAITVVNESARALRDVPIEFHVHDARGASIYANDIPGLGAPLTSLASLGAHASVTWVDDQVQPAGSPTGVRAIVGEGAAAGAPLPQIAITGAREVEDPANGPGAEGSVVNHSTIAQQELVIYAVALRGTRVVAAGRAVLQQLPAGTTSPFHLFFIGEARGARLQLSAPATTLR